MLVMNGEEEEQEQVFVFLVAVLEPQCSVLLKLLN
jgi:hypothetical protein